MPEARSAHMFSGRKLVIATKHRKETVIAPVLGGALQVECLTPAGIDTDVFGTFSGEITREKDPVETARQKCLLGLSLTGCDLGIASEGSFGPHPAYGFIHADSEVLVLIDQKHGFEFCSHEISTRTNFNGGSISGWNELIDFARTAMFPSHGLILKRSEHDHSDMVKGISSWPELLGAFQRLTRTKGRLYAETDMRAHFNPSRMKVIEAAAHKLVGLIASECPACGTPGFSADKVRAGLPCGECGAPTASVLSHRLACRRCSFTEERLYPHGKQTEEPMFCDRCNP